MTAPNLRLVQESPFDVIFAALERGGFFPVLQGAEEGRRQATARCTVHADTHHPNLQLAEGDDGRALIFCNACKSGAPAEKLIEPLRHADGAPLQMSDLFPDSGRSRGRTSRHWTTAEVAEHCSLRPIYPTAYTLEDGTTEFIVCRWDPPGERKKYPQFRPDGRGRWVKSLLPTTRKVPLNLPAVLRAVKAGETVHIAEGEPCVWALTQLGYTATTNSEGTGKWNPECTKALAGVARAVLWPDNDDGGVDHMRRVATELVRTGVVDVRLMAPFAKRKKYDIHNWHDEHPETADTGKMKAELERLVEATARFEPVDLPGEEKPKDPRPVVRLGVELADSGDQALLALAATDCGIYVRGGGLVCVRRDAATKLPGLMRAPDAPTIQRLASETLQEILSRAARFEKWNEKREAYTKTSCPLSIAKALLARGQWDGLPVLEAIVESPVIRPDGSLVDVPGHDKDSGLLYAPSGPPIPRIEVQPDYWALAADAAATLLSPFRTYRWADEAAAVPALLAAILTVTARHLIGGPVPMYCFDAPQPRSGKGKACESVGIIGLGRSPAAFSGWKPAEEYDKLFAAIAQEGDRVVVLDNVVGPLRSPELAYAITTGTYRSREFGQNRRTLRAPWVATVLANGNNLRLASDLSYRALHLRIDWKTARPDLLQFPYDIVQRVREERPAMYAAAATILRAFIRAGKPAKGERWCDFEAWDALVRQCVVWVGAGDPLKGREKLIEEADDDLAVVREVFDAWNLTFEDRPTTTAEAIGAAGSRRNTGTDEMPAWEYVNPELRAALLQLDSKGDGKTLNPRIIGRFLRDQRDRIVGDFSLTVAGEHHSAALWKVGPPGTVDPRPAQGAEPPPKQETEPTRCYICKGEDFWTNRHAQRLCARCHPNPEGDEPDAP